MKQSSDPGVSRGRGRGRGKKGTPEAMGDVPRYRAIYETLLDEIRKGVYRPGERLPSESVLCTRFDASRITVAKALQTLQQEGLIWRRAGSGTYVEKRVEVATRQFGLLIPDLGSTEIFESICKGIVSSPEAAANALIWGHAHAKEPTAVTMERLCRQYITQKVSGVFFAPTEFSGPESNRRIATMLEQSGLPVVLLDRDFEDYPRRSRFDMVGINNHGAAYLQTQHLAEMGAKRIVFAMRPGSANTVDARAGGYREAMMTLFPGTTGTVVAHVADDAAFWKECMEREQPDGIVCANDVTAAALMRTLIALGYRIPEDVRMIGLDDVSYAQFLPTPLTTMRQDTMGIGIVAMDVMLQRIAQPERPVVDVRLRTELVVRSSCGAKLLRESRATHGVT